MFKPAGYPSLSPYLIVTDAEALLAFARAAFDATPTFVHREAGRIRHAELRIDAELPLECQSSLRRFLLPVQLVQRLGLIRDEADEARGVAPVSGVPRVGRREAQLLRFRQELFQHETTVRVLVSGADVEG